MELVSLSVARTLGDLDSPLASGSNPLRLNNEHIENRDLACNIDGLIAKPALAQHSTRPEAGKLG
jgi:hypothetical protein